MRESEGGQRGDGDGRQRIARRILKLRRQFKMGANSSRRRACPRLTLPGARDMRNAKTEPCMQLVGPLIPQQHCIPAPRCRWSLFGPFSEPGLACLATEPRGRRRKASRLLVINFAPGFVGWDPFFVPRLLCRGCDQPRCPPVLDLLDPWNLRLTAPAQRKKPNRANNNTRLVQKEAILWR